MEVRLGEQPLWGRHCEPLLKRASLTCRRPAISVWRTLFESCADYLASFDQLHSCTALLLSLSLILQQLRLSCWLTREKL